MKPFLISANNTDFYLFINNLFASYLVLQSKYFGVHFIRREHRFAPQSSPVTICLIGYSFMCIEKEEERV